MNKKLIALLTGTASAVALVNVAMAQDDGHGFERLQEADVLVLGVSRTSKTPTCIYLAQRGIRAANIPLIPGQQYPDLEKVDKPLIVGLTNDPDRLIAIRREGGAVSPWQFLKVGALAMPAALFCALATRLLLAAGWG